MICLVLPKEYLCWRSC